MHLCLTFVFIAGLEEPQFVEFNGGFSQAQLDWFSEVLKFADENQEKVVVMGRWMQGMFGDRCKAKLCTSALVEENVAALQLCCGRHAACEAGEQQLCPTLG